MTISACWSLLFGFGPDHARINPRVEHLGQVLIRASCHTIDRILTNVFRLHPYHLVLVGCITVLFVHLPDVKSFQHKLQNNNSIGYAQHLLNTAWMEALVLEDVFYKRLIFNFSLFTGEPEAQGEPKPTPCHSAQGSSDCSKTALS